MGFFIALFIIYLYIVFWPAAVTLTALAMLFVEYRIQVDAAADSKTTLPGKLWLGWIAVGTLLTGLGALVAVVGGADIYSDEPNVLVFTGILMMIPVGMSIAARIGP